MNVFTLIEKMKKNNVEFTIETDNNGDYTIRCFHGTYYPECDILTNNTDSKELLKIESSIDLFINNKKRISELENQYKLELEKFKSDFSKRLNEEEKELFSLANV